MRRADLARIRRLVAEATADGCEAEVIADGPDGPVITYTDGTVRRLDRR